MSAMSKPSGHILYLFGAEIAQGETVESYFDDVLGLWTRNEDVRRDFEFEAPEFLFAGEVLSWNACGAAFDQREIILRFDFREWIFGMRVERSPCAARSVEQEQFGGQRMGGNICCAQLRDS